ncbi:putative nuclease harbi1, partial [Blyttiomyces sp. JEL0837]
MAEQNHRIAIAAAINGVVTAAIHSISATVLAVATSVDVDARAFRNPISRRFSSRVTQWHLADSDPIFDHGWFFERFRCRRETFDSIVQMIENAWNQVHQPVNIRAHFSIRERVASTLSFLTHQGNLRDTGHHFGMGKASVQRYVWQVIAVLLIVLKKQYVKLPACSAEWKLCQEGMEARCGYPGACLAVDG